MSPGTARLGEVLDVALLRKHVAEGNIHLTRHYQDRNLVILSYAKNAASFDAARQTGWDRELAECRGLIVQSTKEGLRPTDPVVARPWPKFFNHNEPNGHPVVADRGAPCTAAEKIDGSLGILYWDNPMGQWSIATRGSFLSVQARHASHVLRVKHADWLETFDNYPQSRNVTVLFEIVYPGNRIVVDNGRLDDLVMLGWRNIHTGRVTSASGAYCPLGWAGPVASRVPNAATVAQALALPATGRREGMVLYVDGAKGTGPRMVKVKEDWYLTLHRAVTNLSEKTIWKAVSGFDHGQFGESRLEDVLNSLDEEHQVWAQDVAHRLWLAFSDVSRNVKAEHDKCWLRTAGGHAAPTRAEFVREARGSEYFHMVMAWFDGKDFAPAIWRSIKPKLDGRNGSPLESTREVEA